MTRRAGPLLAPPSLPLLLLHRLHRRRRQSPYPCRLQVKLERLPEVARAFVHLDYETQHSPGVEHKEM